MDKKKDKKAQKAVHLVENLPPLPAKLVEMIQEGSFVDFSWFPVLEDGPSDGEWRNYASESGEGGPSGVGTGKKRKLWNEVPDVSWWGTCFSLFRMAPSLPQRGPLGIHPEFLSLGTPPTVYPGVPPVPPPISAIPMESPHLPPPAAPCYPDPLRPPPATIAG